MKARYPIGGTHAQIAIARRMLARNGCESGTGGSVTLRVPGQDAHWATPEEQYFGETVPGDVGIVGFDNEQRDGLRKLAGNFRFYAAIYKRRPDVNAVIHLHSYYSALWSATERPVPMWHQDSAPFLNQQAYYVEDGIKPTVYAEEIGDLACPDKRVVFLKNHGCILASDTLEHCVIEAIALERTCAYAVLGAVIGGTPMGIPETVKIAPAIMNHYAVNMWTANVRRLRRSDPDLFALIEDDGRFEEGVPFVKGEAKGPPKGARKSAR